MLCLLDNFASTGYVGFDPVQNTVIVAHQGTNTSSMYVYFIFFYVCHLFTSVSVSLLSDADILMLPLDGTLFPGIGGLGASIEVHNGFATQQAEYVYFNCNYSSFLIQ